MEVSDINFYSLFIYSRLVCIFRGLNVEMKSRINENLIIFKGIDFIGYYIN